MKVSTNQYALPYYESIEFNLSTGQTDYNVASNQATFLEVFGPTKVVQKHPTNLIIRTNQTITVKFNSASNHAITVTSTDSPLEVSGLEVQNVFLTNSSGSTAAIKILVLA